MTPRRAPEETGTRLQVGLELCKGVLSGAASKIAVYVLRASLRGRPKTNVQCVLLE